MCMFRCDQLGRKGVYLISASPDSLKVVDLTIYNVKYERNYIAAVMKSILCMKDNRIGIYLPARSPEIQILFRERENCTSKPPDTNPSLMCFHVTSSLHLYFSNRV